ncbi:MAG: hypothetical protein Q9211_003530 [Gyalolechia sp. 1 TL-2023]
MNIINEPCGNVNLLANSIHCFRERMKEMSTNPPGHHGSGNWPPKSPFSPPKPDDDDEMEDDDDMQEDDEMEEDDDDDDEMDDDNEPLTRPRFMFGEKPDASKSNLGVQNPTAPAFPQGESTGPPFKFDVKPDAFKSNLGVQNPKEPAYSKGGRIIDESTDKSYLKICGAYKDSCDRLQAEQSKNETLQSNNATLQSMNETLQAQIDKLNIDISRDGVLWKGSLHRANNEKGILSDQVAELNGKLEKTEEALKEKVPNAQFYLDQISAKDAIIEKCSRENEQYLDQVKQLQNQAGVPQDQARKLQEMVTTLEMTNQGQRAIIVANDETLAWMRKEYDEAKDELTKGKSKWNNSLRAKDAELAKKTVEISEKQLDYDLFKRKAHQTLQSRDKTIAESKAREQTKDLQLIQLQAQLSGASTQSEPLNMDTVKAIQERNEEIANYQAKEQAREQEMSQLRADFEKKFKDIIAHAEAEVAKRDTQIAEYQAREGAKDRDIWNMQTERIGATEKFHKVDNERKVLRGKLESANAARATMDQEITKLKAELRTASGSDNTLRAEANDIIQAQLKQIDEQNNELALGYQLVPDLYGQIAAKDEEINQLRAGRSATSSDNFDALKAGAEEEIEVRDRTIDDQKKELASALATVNELRSQIDAKDQEINQLRADRSSTLPDDFDDVREDAEEKIEIRDRVIEEQRNDLANAATTIKELRDKVDAKDQEVAQLKAERSGVSSDDLHAVRKDAEETIKVRDRAIEDQKKDLANALTAMEELRGKIDAKDQEVAQLKAERSGISSHEYEAWKTQMEGAIQARDRTIEELKIELTNKGITIEEYRGREQARDQEIDRLTNASNALKNAKDQETAQIAQLAKDHDDASKQRDQKIKEQDQQMTEMGNTLNHLHTTVQAKDEEIVRLTNASNALKNAKDQETAQIAQLAKDHDDASKQRDQKIEEQNQQMTEMGNTVNHLRATVQAKDEEIVRLTNASNALQAAKDQEIAQLAKGRDDALKQRDQKIKEQDQKITEMGSTIDGLRGTVQAIDEEIVRLTNASNALKDAKDQEIAQLAKERDDASAQVSILKTKTEEAVQDLNQMIKEQNEETTTEDRVQYRDQKIKEQNEEITRMGNTIDELRTTVQVKDKKISDLHRKVQAVEDQIKASVNAENQLTNLVDDQKQTIKDKQQTIIDLHKTLQDLRAQIKLHEMEKEEISKLLEGNQSESAGGNLTKSFEQQKASYEKKLSDQRRDNKQAHMAYQAFVDNKFGDLESAMEGIPNEINGLHRFVQDLAQTSTDLQDELNAAIRKSNQKTQTDAATEVTDARPKAPTMMDAATQVEAGDDKRPDNELRQFSPQLPPVRNLRRMVPQRIWWSSSESEEEEVPQPPPRVIRRRRQSSSPVAVVRTRNASTQTQTGKPATSDMGTQTAGERKRVAVNRGTQTDPIHPPPAIAGAPTSPQISSWRRVPWWLLLLVLAVLLAAALSGISAHQERMMWLGANDYTRRAVVSVRVGGGTGTKVPAWLWREPLVTMTNRYF